MRKTARGYKTVLSRLPLPSRKGGSYSLYSTTVYLLSSLFSSPEPLGSQGELIGWL